MPSENARSEIDVISKKKSRLLFLGCGASAGVPVIGCSCRVCSSEDIRDKRTRSSIYITTEGGSILVDASPDLRFQALRHAMTVPPDALFLTHTHYDHIGGLEELRAFNFLSGKPIPCYLSHESYIALEKMYYYHFLPRNQERNYTASFDYHLLPSCRGEFDILGKKVCYSTYWQGTMSVLGFRMGNAAYMTDMKEYDETSLELVRGVETLIVSASGFAGSKMQLSVDEALEFIRLAKPKRAIIMHMSHSLGYLDLSSKLPSGVEPAFDGMEIDFEW